jgi:uncharacterized membrane protein YjfL (UPF0719 family)
VSVTAAAASLDGAIVTFVLPRASGVFLGALAVALGLLNAACMTY